MALNINSKSIWDMKENELEKEQIRLLLACKGCDMTIENNYKMFLKLCDVNFRLRKFALERAGHSFTTRW